MLYPAAIKRAVAAESTDGPSRCTELPPSPAVQRLRSDGAPQTRLPEVGRSGRRRGGAGAEVAGPRRARVRGVAPVPRRRLYTAAVAGPVGQPGACLRACAQGGSRCADSTAATFCANVLELLPAVWRFVVSDGVEPTNNYAERVLRRG